jgi:hypothetical protein
MKPIRYEEGDPSKADAVVVYAIIAVLLLMFIAAVISSAQTTQPATPTPSVLDRVPAPLPPRAD